jgi:Leu/Phe-tRNA-protein transferase
VAIKNTKNNGAKRNPDTPATLMTQSHNCEARNAEVHMSDTLIAPLFGLTLGGLFVAAHVLSAVVF